MNSQKLNNYEKLLIGAVIVSPFTLLRVGFLGLAEITFLLIFFKEFTTNKIGYLKASTFSRFWQLYLIVSLMGFCYNVLILDHKTGTLSGMVFDFSAYGLILMACLTLEGLIIGKKINTYLFVKYVFLYSSSIMLGLYILSQFTSSLLGLPLKYHNFFAPLASNLHQISMFLVPLPFIGIKVFQVERRLAVRIYILILIVANVIMASETGSEKAIISLFVGTFILCIWKFFYSVNQRIRNFFILILLIMALFIFILKIGIIGEIVKNYFDSIDVGGGRAFLYGQAIEVGLSSPLVGLGTGPHIFSGNMFWDAHQTFITAFLQTGLLGIILLSSIFFKTAKKLMYSPPLLAAFAAIMMYALGGDILRRLPIWIMLVLLFHYNKMDEKIVLSVKSRLKKGTKGLVS